MSDQFHNMEKDYQSNVNSEGNQSAKNRFTFVDFSKRGFGRLNVSDKEFVRPGPVNTAAVNRPQPPSVPNTSTATEPEPEVRKRFVSDR